MEDTLNSPQRVKKIIIGELEDVKKKYAVPRRTDIVLPGEDEAGAEEDDAPAFLLMKNGKI